MADIKKTVAIEIAAQTTGAGDVQALAAELGRLQAASADAASSEAKARADALAARKAYDEQRSALDLLKASTDKATKGTAEYEAQERALTVTVANARAAMRDKQTAVVEAATAARTAAAAEQQLKGQIESTAAAAVLGAKQQAAANKGVTVTLEELQGQLRAVQGLVLAAFGGSVAVNAIKSVADTADAYNNLAARVKLVSGSAAEAKQNLNAVFDVADRSGVAVAGVGALVTRLASAGKEVGITNQQALQLAESVTQALALSGATVAETESVTTQISQAISANKLGGDELRAILEGGGRLAQALAAGLGTTVGALKDLGSTGALTAQQVVNALLGQSAALQREYSQLPPTVGRALAAISNEWTRYVGEVDKATGASAAAATVLQGLAHHMDTLGALLFSAGKAAAAYAAVRLAQSFIEQATAVRAATVAVEANTTALAANAVAGEGAAASVGRFASLLGTLKLVSLIGIVTNFRELGTAIGETIAKILGAGKGLEDLERKTKADEAATRANAAAKAELAQRSQQAADAALGLNKESKALIATYEGLIQKGESAADALAKVSKELQLGDVKGVTNAIAALDALQVKGKITAQQITDALAASLKGDDLLKFETLAKAAFDGSAQGVRRLGEALDAVASESLRRAGTSVLELRTGFSTASASAVNDLDAVVRTLDQLGVKGGDAGRAIVAALDHAVAAANTEKAAAELLARVKQLGDAGKLTGEALAGALDRAQRKLDDLTPGVQGLSEALRAFGFQTATELTATADRLAQAYATISASSTTSLATQIEAFIKWRDAAVAAGKNVEDGQVRIAQVALEIKANAAGMGDALVAALDKGAQRADGLRTSLAGVAAAAAAVVTEMDTLAARNASVKSNNGATASSKSTSAAGQKYDAGGFAIGVVGAGQLQPPDNGGGWTFDTSAAARAGSPGGLGRWVLTPEEQARRGAQESARTGIYRDPATGLQIPAPAPAPAATPSAAPSAPVTVRLDFGTGQVYAVETTGKPAADTLVAALAEAAKRAGGTV